MKWAGVVAVTLGTLILSACSSTSTTPSGSTSSASTQATSQNTTPQTRAGRPTLKEFCGSKPVKVAYIVGFGDNSWRKTTLAEVQNEASLCKNVTLTYFNANNDQNQYLQMINSATAQGYNAIITYDDFGAAAVPALHQAFAAGLKVIPFEADPTGKVGVDYTGFVSLDTAVEAQNWVDFFNRAIPKGGKIAFFGGTPGAPLSAGYWKDFSADLGSSSSSGLSLEGSGPITTNWTPAGSQQAASGLFSQYPDTAGVIVDYLGGGGSAIVNEYTTAGKPLVPIAGGSATNQLVCQYQQLKATNPNFQLFSMDGDVSIGRVALRQAVASFEGINDPESWVYERSVGIDTTKGVVPACESNLPPDLPLNSQLTTAQLEKVFG